ncbi:hypothetical protein [Solimonas flava]|uniref:hypothetical protein n=1 Tax=Solimonas flava TaxID=415849 RepID=UPI0003FBDC23|nr:hypothetical protein [Solimonas flava]
MQRNVARHGAAAQATTPSRTAIPERRTASPRPLRGFAMTDAVRACVAFPFNPQSPESA